MGQLRFTRFILFSVFNMPKRKQFGPRRHDIADIVLIRFWPVKTWEASVARPHFQAVLKVGMQPWGDVLTSIELGAPVSWRTCQG